MHFYYCFWFGVSDLIVEGLMKMENAFTSEEKGVGLKNINGGKWYS
jgi:hypothetical protein